MKTDLIDIASKFNIKGEILSVEQLGEGFINDTYIVRTSKGFSDYILQRKNKNIFTNIPAMMDNISRVTAHIKTKVKNPLREALTVVSTQDGKLYHLDNNSDYWAMCILIEETITYQSAQTPELAYQGGKGIGQFQAMLSDFVEPLADILPGFHNMRYRFQQWDAVLAKDPVGRKKECQEQILWIECRRDEMLAFWNLYEKGIIPTRVTHNDTKINNILFDTNGNVLCVIDLDTVLSSTCLNDYGDAMRSYTNKGAEDDECLERVEMDLSIFEAYTRGYLSEMGAHLNQVEREYLAFSAKYITFEQVLRFLMDYVDGDHYYKIKSPKHNLIRTKAQYKLLQSMEQQYDEMCEIVNEYYLNSRP